MFDNRHGNQGDQQRLAEKKQYLKIPFSLPSDQDGKISSQHHSSLLSIGGNYCKLNYVTELEKQTFGY